MRSEQEIFENLASLCSSQGFIHAVAHICFRDNIVGFRDELRAEDMAQRFSQSCLIRTEVTTLIGLMMRAPIDLTTPRDRFGLYRTQRGVAGGTASGDDECRRKGYRSGGCHSPGL